MKTNNKILKSFLKIHKSILSKNNYQEIKDALKTELAREVKFLKSYLKTKKEEDVIIITLLVTQIISSSDNTMSYESIQSSLKIRKDLEIWLEYLSSIKKLSAKGIINSETGHEIEMSDMFISRENGITLSSPYLLAILENKPFHIKKERVVLKTAIDVVHHCYQMIENLIDKTTLEYRPIRKIRHFESETINKDVLRERVYRSLFKVLNKKKQFSYINFLLEQFKEKHKEELLIYIDMVWDFISGRVPTNISKYFEALGYSESDGISFINKLNSKKNILTKYELIEPYDDWDNSFNIKRKDYQYVISEKSVQFLYQFKLLDSSVKLKAKRTLYDDKQISYSSIEPVELFYSKKNKEEIDRLIHSLTNEKLKEIRERMQMHKFSTGINILFYGYPGTGKTETVKQIARMTKRDIFWVDVSELKSMWYGQTEKNIRRLFDRYREYCEGTKNSPILLFNEADAIISKRQQVFNPIGQVENSIQNILLEEMEKHSGILIATTNLLINFDPAFERRFLFKIEFDKPDVRIRAKIWKSKLSYLSESDCEELAREFEFSGGQIDNICKKAIIDEILTGQKANFFQILQYCQTERWNAQAHLF